MLTEGFCSLIGFLDESDNATLHVVVLLLGYLYIYYVSRSGKGNEDNTLFCARNGHALCRYVCNKDILQ